jgi:SNF2 family DNA or RNA helicase
VAEPDNHGQSWAYTDGAILRVQSGVLTPAQASEVISAAFDVHYTEVRPQDSLPSIDFIRLPHKVGARVRSEDSGAKASLIAIWGTDFVEFGIGQDNVIVNGLWAPIRPVDAKAVSEGLNSVGIKIEEPFGIKQLLALRLAILPFPIIDDVQIQVPALETPIGGLPPAGLTAQLYDYQRRGLSFLRLILQQEIGCILGDEMGLGKTLQVLALMLDIKHQSKGPCLVICPKSLIINWEREATKFTPSLTTLLHQGKRSALPGELRRHDVVITTYDTLVSDQLLFNAIKWHLVVVDEAQAIKNPKSKRSQAVRQLPREASIAVTGTPIETHVENAWSLMDFCVPRFFGDLRSFQSRFEESEQGAERLAPFLEPLLLRRRVAEVAQDLPNKVQIPQIIPMGPSLIVESLRVESELYERLISPLDAYRQLRMMTSHAKYVALDGSEKTDRLVEIVEEIFSASEKVLIFAHYYASIDGILGLMRRRFSQNFSASLDGRISRSEDRLDLIDQLTSTQGGGSLILNPRAVGVGLNIVSANHVIHFSPEWNPAITDQASARSHRRGQDRPVTVHHFAYADSIEERVLQRSEGRRQLAEIAAPGSNDEPTAQDLANLFSHLREDRE